MKTHKRKKRSRIRGSRTAWYGARKKHKKSGHRGGSGMSGSGKRADQKKTLVLKLFGNAYFGKQGETSKGTRRNNEKKINVGNIEKNIENLIKFGKARKTSSGFEIDLKDHVILGDGEVKGKLIINAKRASATAMEKVKKAGGEIIVKNKD